MYYRVNQTVILDNNQCVRIIEVDESRKVYKGRTEDTYEEVTFPESRILTSY